MTFSFLLFFGQQQLFSKICTFHSKFTLFSLYFSLFVSVSAFFHVILTKIQNIKNYRLIIGKKMGFAPHLNYWGRVPRLPPPESTPMALTVKSGNNKMIYQDILTALADAVIDLSMPCHVQRSGTATDPCQLFYFRYGCIILINTTYPLQEFFPTIQFLFHLRKDYFYQYNTHLQYK